MASSPRRKSSGVSKAIAIWALSFTIVVFFVALSALNIVVNHRVGVQPIRSLPPSCSGPGDRHRQLPCSPFPPSDVLIAAVNANVRQAALAARAVQAAVLIVGFAVALEHLAIGRGVVLAAFSIAFGGIVLALALAFGLAGKDIARDLLERNVKGRKDDGQTDEIDHPVGLNLRINRCPAVPWSRSGARRAA